jgi:hypothetical protein
LRVLSFGELISSSHHELSFDASLHSKVWGSS